MKIIPLNLVASVIASMMLSGCTEPSGASKSADNELFDIILVGGRVIDPETGLDAVRDVGIRDGRIVAVSEKSLGGQGKNERVKINVKGLVVAPGFIDLHAHGMSAEAFEYRAMDGVTTALELEWGYPRIKDFIESRSGKARINFGASVSHGMLRGFAMPHVEGEQQLPDDEMLARAMHAPEPMRAFRMLKGLSKLKRRSLPEGKIEGLYGMLERELNQGGLGIGMAHQYYPGASRREIYRVFQFAGRKEVPIFTHVREMNIGAMQEVIANAASTGAPLHIVHVNSMSLGQLPEVLELISGARERGLDLTTEAYPYTAASTDISSAIFDEGWQEILGISYGDVQWQDTGERLTKETFDRYRKKGGVVIIHMMKEEMIELAMRTPFVMIASDAMPYAKGAHPRSAGTFCRVLSRYVRERKTISLIDALGKMSLMPADRLSAIAPKMKNKGRIQLGADADIVIFDPETVSDRATFDSGLQFSTGMHHVIVSGAFVVRDEKLVPEVYPGLPVVGRYAGKSTSSE